MKYKLNKVKLMKRLNGILHKYFTFVPTIPVQIISSVFIFLLSSVGRACGC